ncbi:anti-sigma factor antagonist [Roseococcus sp. SDR]|uniref:anti-sigma factor antagonist n=1 Tax=Roseococcus sp. SDR TaxID=2835532 RepID=UPI001BCDC7B4|nr:anti-sigma factor antagonist [Roseococcus sp. SDR]MBS7792675.1 anti-sigma factor antagonist [Roseococcus sp. SDR]MBV1847989.1 anti-sigma factor antagonist [Roseococcus sp. SDR]
MQIGTRHTGDTLTLVLAGRLDATTASLLGQALVPGLQGVRHLVVDLDACPYVSSAGLRELLRAQRHIAAGGGSMLLDNVSGEVQHVLNLTGFSGLIPSRRKVRQIAIDGLEFMSAGVCGECYRLDRETIVKLYNEGIGADVAEKEKTFAKAAFMAGIPTAISYDVVACGNRTGVVYEMLDASLFSAVIRNDPGNVAEHARTLARIARTVHATPADPAVFPDIKESLRGYIDQLGFFLSPHEIALLHSKLAAIPDAETFVHFDLHSSNIMIRDGEPVIIDMGDLSRGHALFDIGLLAMIYGLPELGLCELATKIPEAVGLALWENFLSCYFADRPPEERALFEANKHFLASMRLIYTITFLPALRDRCASLIKDVLMPRIAA